MPLLITCLLIIVITVGAIIIADKSGLNAKLDGWVTPLIGLIGIVFLLNELVGGFYHG